MIEVARANSEAAAGGSDVTFTCQAEIADCNCPDSCERDHGND